MPDIIDLLSSPEAPALDPACPPSSPLLLPRTRLDLIVVRTRGPTRITHEAALTAPCTASGVTPGGFYLLSDDFDTTGDLEFSVVAATPDPAERAVKRTRLSPGRATGSGAPSERVKVNGGVKSTGRLNGGRSHSAAAGKLHARPGVLQPSGVRRWNALADPIQHSSSPDPVRAPERSNGTSAAAHPPSRMRRYDEFEDPFASSSSPAGPPAAAVTTGRKENDYAGARKAPISAAEGGKGKVAAAPPVLSLLDDDDDPFASPDARQAASPRAVAENKRQKPTAAWDPIISSSAPEETISKSQGVGVDTVSPRRLPPRAAIERSRSEVIDILDSSEWEGGGGSRPGSAGTLTSDDSLPDVGDLDFSKLRSERPSTTGRKGVQRKATVSAGKASSSRVAAPKPSKTTGSSSAQVVLSATEKAEKAAARAAERERKKLEREQARAEKAAEKIRAAALAEINKARTDKKHSTPEMIVDLPAGFNPTIRLQVETLLGELEVECTTVPPDETGNSTANGVVTWRRKVKSRYDEELGHWEPTPLRIEEEDHVLVLLPAAELVNLALGRGKSAVGAADGQEEGATLDDHVEQMRARFPGRKLIYLIEGLLLWMRKNRTVRNRQFTAAVRGLADAGPATAAPAAGQASTGSRRRKNAAPPPEYVDEDVVEDALLNLQVVHGALIHHTSVPVESAQWIVAFTQHISTIPYKRTRERANDAGAAFCMDVGQVRTGDGAADTYVRMLQEIVRVTAPIAHGVAARYPTVSQLVRGLESAGPLALEAVPRSTNRDGEPSDRAIGQAVSRRMHKVFTGRDPGSTDV
ncbi:hypothetical protein MAPG_00070 [Magnaporthiopsis poae ATCC 64411]|uniref:ERCC4 domain-containing protein n=1 Tax=Magnaporthiopsis poae (strain ATCC 64411 / 73-15) TaxID=644358 RepID=A0A0C4DK08_MAGP6|nr:hypothetical protein MAPG_00070 [Magnaporthiopsis poae ATCC 64411]